MKKASQPVGSALSVGSEECWHTQQHFSFPATPITNTPTWNEGFRANAGRSGDTEHTGGGPGFQNGPRGVWEKFEKALICSPLPGHLGSRQYPVSRQADEPARDSQKQVRSEVLTEQVSSSSQVHRWK